MKTGFCPSARLVVHPAAMSPSPPFPSWWAKPEAAEQLAAEGIDAEVIDLRAIRPLDAETIVNR